MDKLTIKTENTVLKLYTQSLVVSLVESVNGKTGVVVLNANDVGSDVAGSAATVQQNLDEAVNSLNNELSALSGEVETKANAAAVVQALATKADLIDGVIPASQLPSYVDDVLVYPTWSAFPVVGEAGKIYVTEDTNKTYRWSGSGYVVIADGVALGETATTAYRGDRGKAAYDHSLSQGNPHNTTTSDIPEGNKLYFTEDRVRSTIPIWMDINTLAGVAWHSSVDVSKSKIEIAKNQGNILIRGYLWMGGNIGSNITLITHTDERFMCDISFLQSTTIGTTLAQLFFMTNNLSRVVYANQGPDIFAGVNKFTLVGSSLSQNIVYHLAQVVVGKAKV
ncbi:MULTISPECIES: hypothetical protein [unclassified Acinetobacter]|uniref:hypothetical protein n=1 Tax=unclassified Acinetobacter TaxID=196816 RepID=UPI00244BD272|nr:MULTISPECIES: hypothetical protein [unclassified Acinetobacter]MDH0030301.1 hypothetical protein [Acinetobacter sp. GD04021]MDH0885869.1 hypothetical protein [Acinetobacter sp. GD03873]MDH1082489.1 hypothetical protein [Acinetobacter sp. GD03983]MDH2189119.1 hypothetical protein [Acinetobacter sp. GD03645]MDH2202307.1 hypothetical protein [Acinetobacter sp. GD03647]